MKRTTALLSALAAFALMLAVAATTQTPATAGSGPEPKPAVRTITGWIDTGAGW